ncbi:MAG: thiamine pyrophosphate-binding protein, partial [Actinomycetota bacterium]|nr:thiamine pyrophosphate-binding protein [Actinomycetota bacterium]
MSMITCGEATMRLLADYGVDTVFGIPGVHTLDFCRGLGEGPIHHVQARNEQGAGFMADGYARTTGKPGVALVISGPGVTNALTAVGQSYADSIPVLLLSSETDSSTHGKGWGALHEIPDQRAVTDPLTAMSLRANTPDDVPEFVAQAFGLFAGQRPRPVHISVPVDVLALPVEEGAWTVRALPGRAQPHAHDVAAAVTMIALAERPLVMVGGGAVEAAEPIRSLVDALNAPVVASNSGKGIVPDDHPLSLTASTVRPEVQRLIGKADLVVAIGTELAETDSFVDELPINGELLRIDIDPLKINDHYPADLGIVADASATVAAIVSSGDFASNARNRGDVEAELQGIRIEVETNMTDSERRHSRLLAALLHGLPENTVYMGDICQLVYTGAYAFPVREPRRWSYPA